MSFENIIRPLEELEEYRRLIHDVEKGTKVVEIHGISDTEKALIATAVCKKMKKSCVIVTHNDILARKVYEDITFFDEEMAELLESGDMVFHRIDARSNELRQKRLGVIANVLNQRPTIVCASIEALLPKLINPAIFKKAIRGLKVGETIDILELLKHFIYIGYERVDMVEGRGQFSIRGGIIDFYSPTSENAVRIELFDDEIDSIRYFDIITQRSMLKSNEVFITPAREVIYEVADFNRAATKIRLELDKKSKKTEREKVRENISEDLQKIDEKVYFEGIDKYLSFFSDEYYTFFDYMRDCIIIVDEPNRVRQRYDNVALEYTEQFKTLLDSNKLLPEQFDAQYTYDELLSKIHNFNIISLNALLKSNADFKPNSIVSFVSRAMHPFHGKVNLLIDEVEAWKKKRYRLLILSGTVDRGKRLANALRDKNIDAVYKDRLDFELKEGHIVIIPGTVNGGFEFPGIKYAVVSDREVFGSIQKRVEKKKSKGLKVFTDLKLGDFVVHENHGLGQYIGIEKLKVDGISRDYLNIKYQGNDKLFIPTDQLDLIQKYIGNEEKHPKLNKLGGAEWNKVKQRARMSIEDIAEDLIKLYAEREQIKGFSFAKDTKWQKEFEDLFPYEETPDQLRCIEEIKVNMESERVMDRLLCGDVGYGKTEVALRAAFKAVMDGKQVAILVPTTILAQQHYNTCTQRFSNFPVQIDVLSRFRTKLEQKKTLEGVKNGNVDIIIGTHRLLQKDLVFKDLGLLIIDEEQRFGVSHKEKIKQLRSNVDVLTLTATPIPRTLHMSMIGVRDISVIEEPPEERYPVQTYVMEFNEDVIRDAITKEIARGGQVYFLYNKVKTISKMAARLKELVPEAKVAIGHGQMAENALEDTMLDFYNGEFDVLVCTTIIETGLDIPNVNTIIIHDSDKMGLSQLYQLRGRVGRSNRLAYAYLTYQRDKVLTEDSEKRLRAIKEFTEFGSGFKIAMRDLEIRGAGNLLGSAQSGHMEAIGYDLYVKMLEERMRELKGQPAMDTIDTSIEIQISAFIPENYIGDVGQKIEIYKKIASIEKQEDIYDIEDELVDRFGDVPITVKNLIDISYIKARAKKCGIVNINQGVNTIKVKYKSDKYIKPEAAMALAGEYKNRILFNASEQPYFTLKASIQDGEGYLELAKEVIEKISGFNNF